MKLLKTAFLISLFNFFIVGAVVLAMKKPEQKIDLPIIITPTVTPTEIITPTITQIPTAKPKKTLLKTDPFAAIMNLKETITTAPIQPQNIQGDKINNSPTQASPTVQPTTDNRCIISVDGGRYDISVFRNQHSGGNVFQCGADMSSLFHGQHPDSFLQKMAKYKI